jgi:hypothetical protein
MTLIRKKPMEKNQRHQKVQSLDGNTELREMQM